MDNIMITDGTGVQSMQMKDRDPKVQCTNFFGRITGKLLDVCARSWYS